MPTRRGNGNLPSHRFRSGKSRPPVGTLLIVSLLAPLFFLASRIGNFALFGYKHFSDGSAKSKAEYVKLNALHEVESLFPNEVIDVIKSNTDDSGPLNLNVVRRNDMSSSWVLEKTVDVSREQADTVQWNAEFEGKDTGSSNTSLVDTKREAFDEQKAQETTQTKETFRPVEKLASISQLSLDHESSDHGTDGNDSAQIMKQQMEMERIEMQAAELTQQTKETEVKLESKAMAQKKEIDDGFLKRSSSQRQDIDDESDALVRLMRDQLIMARVYSSLANSEDDGEIQRELNFRIKRINHILEDANVDADLPRSASETARAMGQILSKARRHLYDCKAFTKKLQAMLQSSVEQVRVLNKQSAVLRQLVAKTLPKGLHCLSMLLTSEYNLLPKDQREFPRQEKLEDNSLFHYALFSDNVIAASVVVNSTVVNAKEPEKHVFHLVTDKLNYAAMKMWFLANPPGYATIHVQNIDDFKWLNSSYCPVLRQLQTAAMKEYYFRANHATTADDTSSNLKYRNPKYLSMLNHLRFYLPQVYPKLAKILFLDDDIVVQKDLSPLWFLDLHGNVNGAVKTCGESFHRFDKYLNFSNPIISANFDPNACGWAYGMNIFDLQEWKKWDITGIYQNWQSLNEQRELWKLGTLPPGLITFYNLTYSLDKTWHVLGLGYDPNVDHNDIKGAAVVHYNGNMKPWLELSMTQYKSYWTKYVNKVEFLQQCNINL